MEKLNRLAIKSIIYMQTQWTGHLYMYIYIYSVKVATIVQPLVEIFWFEKKF